MGKGNRNKLRRENDNLVNADTKVKAAKKKTNGVPLWAGNMVLGAIGLMLVVVILVTTISSSGIVLRLTKYASSNSYQLTGSQMTYIFRTLYNNFAEQYSSYLSYILDTSKSLKDQDSIYEDENGKTVSVIFDSSAYDCLMKLIPEKAFDSVVIDTQKKEKPQSIETSNTSLSQIKELKELLDMGIITQEEFDLKKKQLLGL
jgi:hypothetical protein